MITRSHALKLHLEGTLFQDYNRSNLLFFDIETTSFTAKNGFIYLIGAIFWQDDSWICMQWFAEHTDEEADVLAAFLECAGSKTVLIHFNGERFDLPFIREKCQHYHLSTTLSTLNSRDLFRMIQPVKKLLGLDSLKQKSLEEFMGIHREDPYTGGDLIKVYQGYTAKPDSESLETLLLHNREDLIGMICILPILSYTAISGMNFSVIYYEITENIFRIHVRLPLPVPKRIQYESALYTLTAEGSQFIMEVYGRHDTLKYFLPNYKNYYYLPKEDMALHKTIASYVDKGFREPAKASNCYTKKAGYFLPQPDAVHTPVFKTDYESKILYFMCKESFYADRESITQYVRLLLSDI